MQALLTAGADVTRLCEGSPALHMAVSMGALTQMQGFSAAAVQLLLQHGAVPYERSAVMPHARCTCKLFYLTASAYTSLQLIAAFMKHNG